MAQQKKSWNRISPFGLIPGRIHVCNRNRILHFPPIFEYLNGCSPFSAKVLMIGRKVETNVLLIGTASGKTDQNKTVCSHKSLRTIA